jgi:hypothetical protein
MIDREFIVAGGNWVIFTLDVPASFCGENKECKGHYTFQVNHREATEKWGESYFVKLLAGPDNTSDYQYLGMLNPQTGQVKLTRASRMTDDSWPVRLVRRIFARLWANEGAKIAQAGFRLMHSGRCGRCGRKLTTPESLDSGLGPVCRMRA